MEDISLKDTGANEIAPSGHIVRVEANLLRFPLFALSTKGLSERMGIRCTGDCERDGIKHRFEIEMTRNSKTPYPGLLSRAVHFALLDILTEEADYPIRNPIKWSWFELCNRLKLNSSGGTIDQMKKAIRATAGLMIWSNEAIYVKSQGGTLITHEKGQSLYQDYEFSRQKRGDGNTKTRNKLWLAEWYLDNLNTFYSCPLNFDLWLALDSESPIASRLYELLFYRFYRNIKTLQFNYSTLANLLPVKEERYRSVAEKQLNPALKHLQAANVISKYEWAESKDSIAKIVFHRGCLVDMPNQSLSAELAEAASIGNVRVETLMSPSGDDEAVVVDFYRVWRGEPNRRPTKDELAYARELLEKHGKVKLLAAMPIVVDLLRKKWPDAKTFIAVKNYIADALAQLNKARKHQAEMEKKRDRAREQEERKQREDAERKHWSDEWDNLTIEEQESIRQSILEKRPEMIEMTSFLKELCLGELKAKRMGSA